MNLQLPRARVSPLHLQSAQYMGLLAEQLDQPLNSHREESGRTGAHYKHQIEWFIALVIRFK